MSFSLDLGRRYDNIVILVNEKIVIYAEKLSSAYRMTGNNAYRGGERGQSDALGTVTTYSDPIAL